MVIRRADKTVIGNIATTTAQLQHVETTIAKEINAFVRLISMLAITTGVIFIVVPLALGRDFLITIILAISLIVGNVPGITHSRGYREFRSIAVGSKPWCFFPGGVVIAVTVRK